jgi:hypothetical protein
LKIHSSKNIITARKKMGQGRSKYYKHWSLRHGVDAPKREFTAQIKRNWMNTYEIMVFRRTSENRYEYAYSQTMQTEDQAITQANLIDWGWSDCESVLMEWDQQQWEEEQDFGVTKSWKEEFDSRYR